MTLFADLRAFAMEHERCGELDGEVEGDWVWFHSPAKCGAGDQGERHREDRGAGDRVDRGEVTMTWGPKNRRGPDGPLLAVNGTRGYGSNVLVALHDAPQTSALFRFGSVVSRQLVFGLPLAAGSRYLKRNVTVAPG